ncbi:MAG: fumarylacetoacetate hydrolase family protein [Acidimicrobiales bacterium]|nr:fumarylacetoacetate hydrolase family protein [Acidimicrobiales bacterium]HRW38939.1 fumarylacetoacetate hydrolase family protein [Aquihabitans sp.]
MYRLLNVDGRAALERDGRWHDLARASGDDSLADPMAAVERSRELHDLHAALTGDGDGDVATAVLGAPVPRPRQVFAIGLNYRDHASESGMEVPPAPLTFTKFPSCIVGPDADVPLCGATVDWEAEIVVAIGREATNVAAPDAWDAIAGITLGQDYSERTVQLTGVPPQFSLGKSFPAFGPIGPALVSTDSFADPDDIGLWCDVDGRRVQAARTDLLMFPIATLVEYLSSICTLWPGDLIFTGTPSGVGMATGTFLQEGQVVTTGAEVIGELRNRCVAGTTRATMP